MSRKNRLYDVGDRIAAIEAAGIELKQHREEIGFVYHHLAAHAGLLDAYCEVGAYEGASLYVYAGLVADGGTVVAIDDGKRGYKKRERLKRAMGMIEAEGIRVEWIRGNSHAEETLEQLKTILDGKHLDFLHIDGDHSEAGSMQDWQMYGPLVRPGGITAFHDVRATPPARVVPTWDNICNTGALTRTICSGPFRTREGGKLHKPCGIGLVYSSGGEFA